MKVDRAFWSGRRVLVTGHTGFKGAWLSLWLVHMGAKVTGLSDGIPTRPSLFELTGLEDDLETVTADVRDAGAVARAVADHRPEIVVHLAAQPLVRRSFADPRGTYEVNVMGTVNLLEAVRTEGRQVRVVVNVTSDKCYENREWEWGYREDEPKGGFDPYSSSKGCSELVTEAFRRSFFADSDGPRLASGRAGNVIGGGDWSEARLIPDVARAAAAGEVVRLRNPTSIRPWQHVLNPLSGYLVLARALWDDAAHADGWNFGPADEDARTVGEVVEAFAAAWPGGLRTELDPGPHPHEARFLKLDSSRARARLGWRPVWGLRDGLAATIAWYAAHAAGEDLRARSLTQIEAFVDGRSVPSGAA